MALDVHVVLVPTPVGPVPTPTPHPFNGVISNNLSNDVFIEEKPAATVDSVAINTPPHIPIGGPSFQKPPSNQGKVIVGSTGVFINGKPAARSGDTAITCNDPVDAPLGKVVAVGTVFIGEMGAGAAEVDLTSLLTPPGAGAILAAKATTAPAGTIVKAYWEKKPAMVDGKMERSLSYGRKTDGKVSIKMIVETKNFKSGTQASFTIWKTDVDKTSTPISVVVQGTKTTTPIVQNDKVEASWIYTPKQLELDLQKPGKVADKKGEPEYYFEVKIGEKEEKRSDTPDLKFTYSLDIHLEDEYKIKFGADIAYLEGLPYKIKFSNGREIVGKFNKKGEVEKKIDDAPYGKFTIELMGDGTGKKGEYTVTQYEALAGGEKYNFIFEDTPTDSAEGIVGKDEISKEGISGRETKFLGKVRTIWLCEIQLKYESEIISKPVWHMYSALIYDKDGDRWKLRVKGKKHIQIGGLVEEEKHEVKEKKMYVQIEHNGNLVWVCVGEVLPNEKQILPTGARGPWNPIEGLQLHYQHATYYGKQYGLMGSALVKFNGKTPLNLKLIVVVQKEDDNGHLFPIIVPSPGHYYGFVFPKGGWGKKPLLETKSIVVKRHWEPPEDWELEDTLKPPLSGDWNMVDGQGVKSYFGTDYSSNIIIHPASLPSTLAGCIGLGHKFNNYGLDSQEASRQTMMEVFELIGIGNGPFVIEGGHLKYTPKIKEAYKKVDKDKSRVRFIITIQDNRPSPGPFFKGV